VACKRKAAANDDAWPACGGAERQAVRSSPVLLDLGLGATDWDAARFYAELGGRRTQPRLQGGGSADGQGPPRRTAEAGYATDGLLRGGRHLGV
jgi:hypothetical protein